MLRVVAAMMLVLAVCRGAAAREPKTNEPAKKPQWQRMLTGEDAKKVEELETRSQAGLAFNNLKTARKDLEQVIELRTRLQGADHWETRISRSMLALVERLETLPADQAANWRKSMIGASRAGFLEKKGEFAKAQPLREERLKSERAVSGEDSRLTGKMYGELAANLAGQGRYAEAEKLQKKAFDMMLRAIGQDHPDTLAHQGDLAVFQRRHGKLAEAEKNAKACLEATERTLGPDHLDTVKSINGLAMILEVKAQYDRSQALWRKGIAILARTVGPSDPECIECYTNLARSLARTGDYPESYSMVRKALEITGGLGGRLNALSAGVLENYAGSLNDRAEYDQARPIFERVLDYRRRTVGERHPDTALSLHNLAGTLHAQGRFADAEALYREALQIEKNFRGDEDPRVILTNANLSLTLSAQDKHAEAERILNRALELSIKSAGPDHWQTLNLRRNQIVLLFETRKLKEARIQAKELLERTIRVFGSDREETAHARFQAALVHHALEEFEDAEREYRAGLTVERRINGSFHPRVVSETSNLALCLVSAGKSARACETLEAATLAYEAMRINAARGIERAELSQNNPRRLLASLTAKTDPRRAWLNAELTFARGLMDQQLAKQRDAKAAPDAAAETVLRIELEKIQARTLGLVGRTLTAEEAKELNELQTRRSDLESRLAAMRSEASRRQAASLDAVQKVLPADAAIIFWLDTVAKTGAFGVHHACVVRSTGDPVWIPLEGEGLGELRSFGARRSIADELRNELRRDGRSAEIPALAAKLRTQRIAPAMPHLKGIKTLYVISTDEMGGLPVELLAPEFTIGYIPSATFLARRAKPSANPPSLLAVGDPIYDRGSVDLPPGGLLIRQVQSGGAADKASLDVHDVILKYGDREIASHADLESAIEKFAESKDAVTVTLWRVDSNRRPAVFTRKIAPGPLGVELAKEPAAQAIADRRGSDSSTVRLRGGWDDLPGTRFEVERIAKAFDQKSVFFDGRASESSLDELRRSGKLASFRFLHFAAHGKGDNVRSFESSLILSQDQLIETLAEPDAPLMDNRLTAREVMNFWKLDADLVTLSACETAIGRAAGGDGLLGFAQAFLLAGSRSVCLSLWKVDDTATALLMARFYENLLGKREGAKPMRKIEALREAKEWLKSLKGSEVVQLGADLRKGVVRGERKGTIDLPPLKYENDDKPFAHPKFWAAFILIGDPD